MIRSPIPGLARSIRISATGAQQNILRPLPSGPALTARPVPIGDLVGVLIVANRHFHGDVQTLLRNACMSLHYFAFLSAPSSSMLPSLATHFLK